MAREANIDKSAAKRGPYKKGKLSEIEIQFVEAYIQERFNAAAAARKLGLNASEGSRFRQRKHVDAYIAKRLGYITEQMQMDSLRVLVETGRIGLANIKRLFHKDGTLKSIEEMPEEITAAISEIQVDIKHDEETGKAISTTAKIKMHSKIEALRLLAQIYQMIGEQTKQSQQQVDVIGQMLLEHEELDNVITEDDIEGD